MEIWRRGQEAADAPDDGRIRRRLAAIMAVDVKGYGVLMDGNEDDAHGRVSAGMDRLVHDIEQASGAIFSFAGDGLMAEFPSAVEALKCALRVQADTGARAAGLPPEQRIEYRIGIHAGEVLSQKGHTGGNAVNIAARLEQIAEPGGIYLSEAVYEQVSHVIHANFGRVGHPNLKNLRDPVVVFSVSAEECRSWAGIPAFPAAMVSASVRLDPRASIAVLPLRVPHDDPNDAALADEIVDDVVHMLGGLSDQIIMVRGLSSAGMRSPVDFRHIRNAMNVRYVLHGSVRRTRDRMRVAVELNEAGSGRVLWSDRFDGFAAEIHDTRDTLAERIGAHVAPLVAEQELLAIRHRHGDNLTAYDLTTLAVDGLLRLNRPAFDDAETLFRRALGRNPDYSPALSYLALWHLANVSQGWSADPAADSAAAEAASTAAVDRDPNGSLALAVHGHIHAYMLKDYRAAGRLLDRALATGTTSPWALGLGSVTRGFLGDTAEALALARKAVSLWPYGTTAALLAHVMSVAHYLAGELEDAASWGRVSVVHNSLFAANLSILIAALAGLGRLDEARGYAARLLEITPTFRVSVFHSRTPLNGGSRELTAERLLLAGLPV
jgi:adenylate cyclase